MSCGSGVRWGVCGAVVRPRTRPLRKRTSREEVLNGMVGRGGSGGGGGEGAEKGVFTLPFSGGRRVQYVGVAGFREKMWRIREEREREARRKVLRGGIVHQGV
ncbi:hypothetical protein LTR48_006668 [Friedmanniomyces endolithicus]|uniref:Uncharacterized protein n=1 Tax=Rachicladosporium monterosium TaxID=1507873 RepID=A0ABR0KYA2_9PEZI|nr:hypothetical protein LTR48_006668 [Friedmanniomyces endolithicus]KAK5140580.1 hypothetical protein LTR32_006657 [Rachicladosporium monterosium]